MLQDGIFLKSIPTFEESHEFTSGTDFKKPLSALLFFC